MDFTSARLGPVQCGICRDDAKQPTTATCGHVYCHDCWTNWLGTIRGTRPHCPGCRQPVKKKDLIKIYPEYKEVEDGPPDEDVAEENSLVALRERVMDERKKAEDLKISFKMKEADFRITEAAHRNRADQLRDELASRDVTDRQRLIEMQALKDEVQQVRTILKQREKDLSDLQTKNTDLVASKVEHSFQLEEISDQLTKLKKEKESLERTIELQKAVEAVEHFRDTAESKVQLMRDLLVKKRSKDALRYHQIALKKIQEKCRQVEILEENARNAEEADRRYQALLHERDARIKDLLDQVQDRDRLLLERGGRLKMDPEERHRQRKRQMELRRATALVSDDQDLSLEALVPTRIMDELKSRHSTDLADDTVHQPGRGRGRGINPSRVAEADPSLFLLNPSTVSTRVNRSGLANPFCQRGTPPRPRDRTTPRGRGRGRGMGVHGTSARLTTQRQKSEKAGAKTQDWKTPSRAPVPELYFEGQPESSRQPSPLSVEQPTLPQSSWPREILPSPPSTQDSSPSPDGGISLSTFVVGNKENSQLAVPEDSTQTKLCTKDNSRANAVDPVPSPHASPGHDMDNESSGSLISMTPPEQRERVETLPQARSSMNQAAKRPRMPEQGTKICERTKRAKVGSSCQPEVLSLFNRTVTPPKKGGRPRKRSAFNYTPKR